ncbi:MAG: formimidoylglutamate deiminase, partial [Pseudomonadota bacterium]|nr:formimidoylglutamate deiminase [Pseudomonadota bacterium]
PGALEAGRERVAGIALPGLPNLHCHAFQRGMAGLTERRGPTGDSFWSWRQLMYHFLREISPDDAEVLARQAYMEMLESGFTTVGEFHYLHHGPDGAPYANLAEMAERIAAAAGATGIGLTLLPCLYGYGSFGGAPPSEGQRRFLNDPERFLRLAEGAQRALRGLPDAGFGVAPHSLRAVTPETLRAVVEATPEGPIHIHAAEQVKEVEDSLAWSGLRPVEWLLRHADLDERWCLIHATHMTEAETAEVARRGAVVGLCPLTEASLGDGIFNGVAYRAAGGRFGVGTDSNIEITAAGELKQLEYSQRLAHRIRNAMTLHEGDSTGRVLYDAALEGGAQAMGRRIGALAPGHRADIVVLDRDLPEMEAVAGDRWLDLYLFVHGRQAVREVYVGGRKLVENGRHIDRDATVAAFAHVVARLAT